MVEDKQHCIDYDTEVLTKTGWKTHDEVTLNDEVAILKDNNLIYEKPIQIFDYPNHQGDMYYVKSEFIDLAVTGEHRMWVSTPHNPTEYDFKFAKDIESIEVYYKNTASHQEDDVKNLRKNILNQFFIQRTIWKQMQNYLLTEFRRMQYMQDTCAQSIMKKIFINASFIEMIFHKMNTLDLHRL